MRKHLRKLVVLGVGLLFAFTGGLIATTAVTNSASAGACYDGKVYFKKAKGVFYAPSSGTYKTSSRCKDINVHSEGNNGGIRVCFYHSDGTKNYCQSKYTIASSGWDVIATNVKDGTRFKLQFLAESAKAGYVAH